MIKVLFNGSLMLLKPCDESFRVIEQLRAESDQKHLRYEVRFGRLRSIYYYDYDGKVEESSDE